jgi:hypothetical protein
VWRRMSPMNSTLFNFVLFPHTVEAIEPSRDDNSSPTNRQTQASSVLDLVAQTTLSTHPTECRVHGFPGLDHAGRDRLPMALDLQDTPSTKSKEHGAQASDRSVDKMQESNTRQRNSRYAHQGYRPVSVCRWNYRNPD